MTPHKLLLLFALVFPISAWAADAQQVYLQCLKNLRDEMQRKISDACWSLAEKGPDKVIDDGSPETTEALHCEQDNANYPLPESSVEKCRKQAGLDKPVTLYTAGGGNDADDDPVTPDKKPPVPKKKPASDKDKTADKDKEEKKDSKVAEKPSTDLPSPSATAADPEADLMSCRRLESNAFNACMASGASSADMNELRRLSSTSPDQNGMGLNEYCRRMDQLTDLAGRTNMAYAASCAVAQSTCRATCEALAENYYEGDETAIKLYVLADACADYGSRANYAAMSGVSTGYNAAYATYCTQSTAAAPNPGTSGGAPGGGSVSPTRSNPVYMGPVIDSRAQVAIKEANQPVKGHAGFQTGTRSARDVSFNLPDTGDKPKTQFNVAKDGADKTNGRNKVNPVSNNTGGAIPGTGAQVVQAGVGGGGGRTTGSFGVPGYTTDVLKGFQGASPSGAQSPSVGSLSVDDLGADQRGTRRAVAGDANSLDLRRFLPGGSRDPRRRRLGGSRPYVAAQINSQHTDIWKRITERMTIKCRLGELIGCR